MLQHLHTRPSKHVRGSGSAPSPSVIRATEVLTTFPETNSLILPAQLPLEFLSETTWSLRTARVGNDM